MTSEIIVRYLHFLSIFCLFAALVMEHLLIGKTMTRGEIKKLSVIDSIYGATAIVVLISGLLLWFVVGKPADYYTQNAVFHTKLLLFVIIAALSVYPTLFYIKNRKGDPNENVNLPKPVVMVVRMELLLLAAMPLLATMMSRGIGYFG